MTKWHPGDVYEETKNKLSSAYEKYYECLEKYDQLINSPCAYCGIAIITDNDKHKNDCREGIVLECLQASIDIEYWSNELSRRGSHI